MAFMIVTGVEASVKRQLVAQAKAHGQSLEAEVREILSKAARQPHIGIALMRAAQEVGGIEDLPVPPRTRR